MNDRMGYVCFSSEVGEHPAEQVRAAAETAGFGKFVHDLSDRSAFIRATRRLVKDGVIVLAGDSLLRDKIDDTTVLTFQFSARKLAAEGVDYTKACVVTFDKQTGAVTCAEEKVREVAVRLCAQLKGIFTPADLGSLVRRVVQAETKRVPLRDAIYFFAVSRKDLVDRLVKFYAGLGTHFTVLPVNQSDRQGPALAKAVIKDMKDSMGKLEREITELRGNNSLTPRIANNRIKELKTAFQQYEELAQALQVDIAGLLKNIGDSADALAQSAMPVDALIAAVQSGLRPSKLVLDLMRADESNKPVVEALDAAVVMQAVDLPQGAQKMLFKNAPVQKDMVDLVGVKEGK